MQIQDQEFKTSP